MPGTGVGDAGRFPVSRGWSTRRPEHRWFTSQYPWELQPICIAPVLPNERLRRFNWQTRAVTDPLVSSIIGWWLEYYWFYVPLSLLPAYDDVVADIESGTLATQFQAATSADASTYYAGRGIDWTKQCRDVVVREWFRAEDEQAASPAPYIRTSPDRPAIKVNIDGIHHSLRTDANMPGGDGTLGTDQRGQEDAYRTWDYLREQGLMQMDYEDWLKSYGVTAPEKFRRKRPILLRYHREWQYPSNTVNQSTGVPVTAVSWVVTGRGDKKRHFPEPGFIVGYTAARPKVYFGNQDAAAATVMDQLRYWMPALLRDDVQTSMREDTATSSPIYDTILAAAHWVDVRDLLIHGDQFMSSVSAAQSNPIGLPTSAAEAKYATQAMAEGLFTNPGSAGLFFVRQDGVARFDISSAVEDAVDATGET